MRRTILLLLLAALGWALPSGAQTSLRRFSGFARPTATSGPTAASPSTAPGSPSWDDYQIVENRNIFAKDRSRPDRFPRISYPVYRPPAPPNESYIVLTGVFLQDDLRLAFFENARTGETTLIQAGQPYGGGTVLAVWEDQVEYRTLGGKVLAISVGQNLQGVTTAVYLAAANILPSAATGSSSQPTTGASSQPAGVPTELPAGASMEERMRLRRLQELR